jgi:hypothetical protein
MANKEYTYIYQEVIIIFCWAVGELWLHGLGRKKNVSDIILNTAGVHFSVISSSSDIYDFVKGRIIYLLLRHGHSCVHNFCDILGVGINDVSFHSKAN